MICKTYYVYILTNINNSVLYVGITNNLKRRVYEHKNGLFESSFSNKYKLCKLVYYEETNDVREAIIREKRIKKWNREWKINLIRKSNPELDDLNID